MDVLVVNRGAQPRAATWASKARGAGVRVEGVLGVGGEFIALKVAGKPEVLKVTSSPIRPEMGQRSFDLPVFRRGNGWLTMPLATQTACFEDLPASAQAELEHAFRTTSAIPSDIYNRREHFGLVDGRWGLLDFGAVRS